MTAPKSVYIMDIPEMKRLLRRVRGLEVAVLVLALMVIWPRAKA